MQPVDSVLGLDEAGRGPLFGPMVLCGVYGSASKLREMGVRDSKQLTAKARTLLSVRIKEICRWKAVVVTPSEIDEAVFKGGLNELEARHFASIIREMGYEEAVVDCADVDEKRFAGKISALSGCRNVTAEHRADVNHPSVSAASIIAKTMRDSIISEIQSEIAEPIGSGYPSDAVSIRFVTKHYMDHSSLPSFVRRSWEPVKRIVAISKVKSLDDFR